MSDMYCVYNGKKYKIKKKNDKYIITSRVRKEDFINYIDVLGNCLLYTSDAADD